MNICIIVSKYSENNLFSPHCMNCRILLTALHILLSLWAIAIFGLFDFLNLLFF
jgi:hypothetical protein